MIRGEEVLKCVNGAVIGIAVATASAVFKGETRFPCGLEPVVAAFEVVGIRTERTTVELAALTDDVYSPSLTDMKD
jgi:hypothetical protein